MIRNVLLAGVVLLVTAPLRADDLARQVIEKAVKAVGGEEALKKYPAGEYKGEGTALIAGESVKYYTAITYALPDQFRMTFETTVQTKKSSVVVIVSGDQVTQVVNGTTIPVAEPALSAFKQLAAIQEASLLYPLLDKDKFTLKAEKDEKVGDKDAAVVLVTRKGMKDVRMMFDKESGLLVRYTRKGIDPVSGKEVDEEVTSSEYQEFSGVKFSTVNKVRQAGKDYMTLKVTEVKLMERVDPKLFK
jgi:hypothetical protein